MPAFRLPPGSGFVDAAVRAGCEWLSGAHGDPARAMWLVPTPAQIPAVRAALAARLLAPGAPGFLPRITTLALWQQDLPPQAGDRPARSELARLLAIRQALRGQTALRAALGAESPASLWGLAQTLLALCDELTAHWLPGLSFDAELDFRAAARRLEAALETVYTRLHRRVLGEEAQLVLAIWRLLSTPDDPLPARWRRLQGLARRATAPVVWIDPVDPGPVERAFLDELGAVVPICRIGADWSAPPAGLGVCWPELRDAPGQGEAAADASAPGPADDVFAAEAASAPAAEDGVAFPGLRIVAAARFEDEAYAAAAAIVAWIEAGHREIALVAQDRIVARRVRALLARSRIPVRDETGWRLSTTRAASAVIGWIDALTDGGQVSPAAGLAVPALIDWLKSPFVLDGVEARARRVATIEAAARRRQITAGWAPLLRVVRASTAADPADGGAGAADAEAACALLAMLREQALRWAGGGRAGQTLQAWFALLDSTLDALGMRSLLAADEAGAQMLDMLDRLAEDAREADAGTQRVALGEFRALLALTLESATYREQAVRAGVRVTILPLASTRMRAFDAVAMVGCSESALPARSAPLLFFSPAVRRELGLPDAESARQQQARDLAGLLLGARDMQCSWQESGGRGDTQRLSGLLVRLLNRDGAVPPDQPQRVAPRPARAARAPSGMPAPIVPTALARAGLARLSAQAYQSLRRCPYQFFAGRLLGLRPLDAIENRIAPSDVGEWLHAILLDFHRQRPAASDAQADAALLIRISEAHLAPIAAEDGHALRWWWRWRKFIPAYLAWQRKWEAEGWRWIGGEHTVDVDLPLAEGGSVRLLGRIDRIDRHAETGALAVLDYKRQSMTVLARRAREAGEDCQLPFYALLLETRPPEGQPVGAGVDTGAWVALDGDRAGTRAYPDLAAHARWLGTQIPRDVDAVLAGQPLPAWGDAAACRYCDFGGLCRRAHWTEPSA